MKRIPALFLIAAPLVPTAAAREGSLLDLGSGKLVVLEDDEALRVHGCLAFRSGSLYEPADAKGTATLLGRLLVSGELATWLSGRGGALSGATDVDAIRIEFECAPADLDELAERLGARLAKSDWTEAEVGPVREGLAAELAAYERSAAGAADHAVDEILFGRFPEYYRTPRSDAVAAVTAKEIAAFQRAHLGQNRLVAGIRAKGGADELSARLRQRIALADVPPPPQDPVRPIHMPHRSFVYLVDVPDAKKTELRLASPAVDRDASGHFALEAWSWTVGGGEHTPLEGGIIGRGLAERVSLAFESDWNRIGAFRGSITAPNDKVGKTLEVLIDLLAASRTDLELPQLLNAQERFKAHEAAAAADPAVSVRRAVDLELFGFEPNWYEANATKVSSAGLGVMSAGVRRHLNVRNLVIVAAGPAAQIRRPLDFVTDVVDHVAYSPREPEALALAERLLAAMGGRKAWARFTGAEMEGSVYVLQGPRFVKRAFHIWRFVDSARCRIDQEALAGDSTLVINGEPGWRQTVLSTEGLANSSYRTQVRNTRAWLYTLLHQLALDDPTLGVALDDEGRLVLRDRLGEVARIELDEDDRPLSLSWTDAEGDHRHKFVLWARAGDYTYAKKVMIPFAHADLEVDVDQDIDRFVPNPEVQASLFERPSSGS